MLCGTIDIPEALLDAQLHNRLVVFCGAGVSAPPPSSLPAFNQLVDEIATASGTARLDGEEPDQCLGRIAEERRFPVHQAVTDRFAAPDSEPCALHRAVVSLFQSPCRLRIVTTNFDLHLSTTANAKWSENVLKYAAPALPLGDSFTGIVYVHGAVGGDSADLVVTDADFGRAYLTRGYARRFLIDCFREHVVLFVGYSHDDRIMQYLARGLPPAPPGSATRFALASAREKAKWSLLGIELVPYDPDMDPGEPHAAVRVTLERWAKLTQRGYAEHEREIDAIVTRGPDVDRESQDYLRRQMQDPASVAFFCKAADDPAWLRWLEDESAFRVIFSRETSQGDVQAELCQWFAGHAVSSTSEAQATVARMGGMLGTDLWLAVIRALWRPRPPAEVLLSWLPILMHSAPQFAFEDLSYILAESRPGDDDLLAVMLFGFLTEPSAVARPDIWVNEGARRHKIELVVRGEGYWLDEAITKVFGPRIEHFADDLLAIATRNLALGHDLLEAGGRASEGWDELSFWRSAIEPHEQDERGQPEWLDVLVDGARAAIDWAVGSDTDLARAYVRFWSNSRAPLLRRLAVYAIGEASWLDDDAKLAWLVEEDRLFSSELRHEVFAALAAAYPNATNVGRQLVVQRLDEGLPAGRYSDDPDLRDRVLFDLLSWLLVASPEDEELKSRLTAVSDKHPEFAPRAHPDMTHWVEVGWVPPPSARSKDEMLGASPDDEQFLAALEPSGDDDDGWTRGGKRDSLLASLRAAAVENPEWSFRLARSMATREMWTSDLWDALVDAWGEAPLTEDQWRQALEVISAQRSKMDSDDSIARLLEDAIRRNPPRLPLGLLPAAEGIADEMLAHARSSGPKPPWESADWIQSAVNEAAGRIMMFFLHALALQQKGDASAPLPIDYQRRFEAAISGDSYSDGLGRAVLAGQLHYLFARYSLWSTESLLPLLEWGSDGGKALQAWHGFLTTGRLFPELAEALVPLYESAFNHLDELGDLSTAFLKHLAYVGLVSRQSPLAAGWLKRFLRECSDADIAIWTRVLGQQLRDLPSANRTETWRAWLEEYWRLRARSRPRPISADEGREFVGWIPDLSDVFVEASDCACESPKVGAHRSFYNRFAKSGIVPAHPADAARLLRHLLEGERREERFWACGDATDIAKAIAETGSAAREDVKAIKNELLRLGCSGASNIPASP